MHCKEIQAVLVEYLDQSLDAGVSAVVKKHIDSCPVCQQELQEVQELLLAMKDNSLEKPSRALRDNFNTLLQSELNMVSMTHLLEENGTDAAGRTDNRQGRRSGDSGTRPWNPGSGSGRLLPLSNPLWKVAAAILLLVGGAWIGTVFQEKKDAQPNQLTALQKEVKEMKQVLLFSLIGDESASQRIKAVSYAEEMSNPDQPVVDALMNTLNNDKNANVRLAALYSLARWADNRTVRDSLVLSLGKQTEPIVQIVLINLLAEKRETRAIAPIKAILSNGKALKEVKEAAQKGLKVL
jgi:hypothetical protein